MATEPITIFAATNFRNQMRRFGIKQDDRRRHMYVIGKTGMGKSVLLENMIIADIQAGNGLAVVDPHGELAEHILRFVPANRINDVVYFNPADMEYPIGFNILETVSPEYKPLIANGLVGVFKKIWADSWGPRLEYILMNTILALLEYPGSTLLGVIRMLVDKNFRKKVVDQINDPVVKSFWVNEFANYNEKFRSEAISPIQNKVGQFLSSSIIRNIVGQPKSAIDIRKIMDEKKILIINLSKGRIGEENSALLGAMLITKIQLAAMSRADIHEEERQDFYLYVDEFQNFATDSFADILSEARKYRLNLIMAHQYIEQLEERVAAAVFGNVGTMVIFRVGATDAEFLEKEFEPTFMATDLVNLQKYHVYMKLMIDGVASQPFSAMGLPPRRDFMHQEEKVIAVSRERYARPKAAVEQRILEWSNLQTSSPTSEKFEGSSREQGSRERRGGDRPSARPYTGPRRDQDHRDSRQEPTRETRSPKRLETPIKETKSASDFSLNFLDLLPETSPPSPEVSQQPSQQSSSRPESTSQNSDRPKTPTSSQHQQPASPKGSSQHPAVPSTESVSGEHHKRRRRRKRGRRGSAAGNVNAPLTQTQNVERPVGPEKPLDQALRQNLPPKPEQKKSEALPPVSIDHSVSPGQVVKFT